MSEAPENALVLKAICPVCNAETITCKFWSDKLPEYGYEGMSEETKFCYCDLDEASMNVVDICCSAFEGYVNDEVHKREIAQTYESINNLQKIIINSVGLMELEVKRLSQLLDPEGVK